MVTMGVMVSVRGGPSSRRWGRGESNIVFDDLLDIEVVHLLCHHWGRGGRGLVTFGGGVGSGSKEMVTSPVFFFNVHFQHNFQSKIEPAKFQISCELQNHKISLFNFRKIYSISETIIVFLSTNGNHVFCHPFSEERTLSHVFLIGRLRVNLAT